MEGMEVSNGAKMHLTSAAAFVEGGIQDALGDACSICLEAFCESDPSTVTSCKHEFHLQCVLEWCQRSSNCPMCWQAISLKDPSSQELLEAVEKERIMRSKPVRNTTVFRHPTLGDFELQHLPVGVDAAELEERIVQHLAAAAAMGRTRRLARREGLGTSTSVQTHPQLMLFSANHEPSAVPFMDSENELNATANDHPQHTTPAVHVNHNSTISPVSLTATSGPWRNPGNNNRDHVNESFPTPDLAGPSELQSISEKLKSRFSSMSMKYKESISRSTREWKEKLFSRSSTMSGIGSDVMREVNAGVTRMIERMEIRENQAAPLNQDSNNNQRVIEHMENRENEVAPSNQHSTNNQRASDEPNATTTTM